MNCSLIGVVEIISGNSLYAVDSSSFSVPFVNADKTFSLVSNPAPIKFVGSAIASIVKAPTGFCISIASEGLCILPDISLVANI